MRKNDTPQLVILAGPNGSGKSTSAPALLQGVLKIGLFVNADTIARGLAAFDPQDAAMLAARLMIDRMDQLANRRVNFAIETTLSGRTLAAWISRLQREFGYESHLIYLWVTNPNIAVARVNDRARLGGHSIPEETIRRRYKLSARNLIHLYLPKLASWRVYNNDGSTGPRLIAVGKAHEPTKICDAGEWQKLGDLAGDTESN